MFTQAECGAVVTCLFALVEDRINLHEEALHAGVGLEELAAVEVDQVIGEATHLTARATGRLLAELRGRAVRRQEVDGGLGELALHELDVPAGPRTPLEGVEKRH